MNQVRQYLDGHIGDLILLSAFTISVSAFVLVVLVTREESTLLGTLAATMGGALGAYMQKRATSSSTTNVENIEKVETTTDDSSPDAANKDGLKK